MPAETFDTFVSSLERLEVQWTCTSTADFAQTLTSLINPPAVAAPLPFKEVTLPEEIPLNPTPGQLENAQTGITAAQLGIANYGSIVIEQANDSTEPVSLFPALHVAVLRASDIVPDMSAAFEWLGPRFRKSPTSAVLATGPSATADMGALVRGAHGPKHVHVVILEDQ